MKKIWSFVLGALFLLSGTVHAASYDISRNYHDDSNPSPTRIIEADQMDRNDWLWGKKPLVGYLVETPVYVDIPSCTYWLKGGEAYVSVLVYLTTERAHAEPATITFRTYKGENRLRKVFLEKASYNDRAENDMKDFAPYAVKNDNGLLLHIFWTASQYSGLTKDLDW